MKTPTAAPAHAMFRAASDRTRLRILGLLRRGELCVCEIVDAMQIPQPRASRHLAYLRKMGLVTARKQGTWIYYQRAPATSSVHQSLLGTIDCCADELPELVRDSKRLRKCC